MTTITLSPAEIEAVTQYKLPTMQLELLHRRGFYRAYIGRKGVVLERGHYDAVVAGKDNAPLKTGKVANLSHFRSA